MTIKEHIEQLTYAYDLASLNVDAILPDAIRSLTLTEALLQENLPTLEARANLVAFIACYYAHLNENPKVTQEEFKAICNPIALEQVSNKIQPLLKTTLDVQELIKFHEHHSKQLTRVDYDRQVIK